MADMNAIARDAGSAVGCVWVEAPARLHMGFIDLNGDLGRRFGSLGMTLEGIGVRLRAAPSRSIAASGPGADRAAEYARRLTSAWDLPQSVRLDVEQGIPEHVGLGSGTQLALAVGAAVARLYGRRTDAREVAQITDRGARSGIGIGAFESGGFIVDGGHAPHEAAPPPVTVRLDVPSDWRVLLVLDRRGQGLHGSRESAAFEALPAFPADQAAHISHLLLMQALPALVHADLPAFGTAVDEIQRRLGDHFAIAQGGRFSSSRVADAMAWLRARGAVGIGQSSWGPTGFCLVKGAERAQGLAADARRHFRDTPSLAFLDLRPRNAGSRVWQEESAVSRHAGTTA